MKPTQYISSGIRDNHTRGTVGKLSERLTREYGTSYSIQNLKCIRQFYLIYIGLLDGSQIGHTLCD